MKNVLKQFLLVMLSYFVIVQFVFADSIVKTIETENVIDVCVSVDKTITTVIYYKEKKGILAKGKEYWVLQNDKTFGPYDELIYIGTKTVDAPIFLWKAHNSQGYFVITQENVYGAYKNVDSERDRTYVAEDGEKRQYFFNGSATSTIDIIKYSKNKVSIEVSPNGKTVIVTETETDEYDNKNITLYANDKKIVTSGYINYFGFFPNSGSFAFVYSKDEDNQHYYCVQLDDKVIYKGTGSPSLDAFLPNNTLCFHTDYYSNYLKYVVYIGNKEIEVDSYPWNITISPNGKTVAFTAGKYLYIEDEKIGPYNEIKDLQFFSDNNTVIYKAEVKNEGWYICANREKIGPFVDVKDLILSPNKDNVAWVAKHKNDKYYVHIDDQEYGPYEQVYTPIFSSNNKTLMYETREIDDSSYYPSTAYYLRVGDEKLGPFEQVHKHMFANDGKTPVYIVKEKDKSNYYSYNDATSYAVYIGSKKFGTYKEVKNIVFAPNNLHHSYLDTIDDANYIELDGEKKIGPYNTIEDINFTPDSNILLFSVKENAIPHMKVFFDGQVYKGNFYNNHIVYIKDNKVMLK